MGDPTASRVDVSRLLGRVAFGATRAQLDEWTGRPYLDLVNSLVEIPPAVTRPPLPADALVIDRELPGQYEGSGEALEEAQHWWLDRMKSTPYPLEERMVLFWHDHFATAVGPEGPSSELLVRQNQMLRDHALGNFQSMCEAVTIDPAMLEWLDGDVNVVGHPNENYARELFELFTLGKAPQVYTERDIREAARVLTGWIVDLNLLTARYVSWRHDKGVKVVFGRTITNQGAEEYKQLVKIALNRPIAPKFLAYKLVRNFAYVPTTTDLIADPDPLIDRVAAKLVKTDWDIKSAMRTLLLSDEFRYADAARGRQVVRQPVELAVHAAKVLDVDLKTARVLDPLARAGQQLFVPPNVGGWPAGRNWLSTTTAIARYDVAIALLQHRWATYPVPPAPLPASSDVQSGAGQWRKFMGLPALRPTTLTVLRNYQVTRKRAGAPEQELQEGIFVLLASSPDWEVM